MSRKFHCFVLEEEDNSLFPSRKKVSLSLSSYLQNVHLHWVNSNYITTLKTNSEALRMK